MVLGTVAELKTKPIAQRLLDPILARINSFDYRPSKFSCVENFADAWEAGRQDRNGSPFDLWIGLFRFLDKERFRRE